MKTEKPKDYKVLSHMFMGHTKEGDHEWYTYQITFNKSLEHTGRFTGIEDGLNAYVKRERRTDIWDALKSLWWAVCRFFKRR